ncbi:MAG: cysteine hydrolase [Candidatus Atribacteria bacterium]|nr:cysteine hydrolase [Candidatus Atribacteria bacterium]
MDKPKTIQLKCRYYQLYPVENPRGCIEEGLTLDLDETVFLIVDVYGLGFDQVMKLGDVHEIYKRDVLEDREIVIHQIKPAKVAAKSIDLPVIYLTNYLAPSTTPNNEFRNMSIRTCGVDALEVWKEPNDVLKYSKIIEPEPGDYLIKKQHYSGFFETHLESLLKELGARNLVTVGFNSFICVHATVLDALYRNYRVIVLRDAIGATEYPETREGRWVNWLAVRFIESNVGFTCTTQDFIEACKPAA